jgi:hypothetical protein
VPVPGQLHRPVPVPAAQRIPHSRRRPVLCPHERTYGKERAERLTAAVTARYGGPPGGKVVIKARKGTNPAITICTITLASGKGTCVLAARQLKTGTYTLTARYLGATDFARSAATAKLTVVR